MTHPIRMQTVLALALAALGGCGHGEITVVNGRITLDGKALDGAQVQLVARDVQNQRAHVGRTDASGTFTIRSDPASGPIEPGAYVVLIHKYESKDGATTMGAPNVVPTLYDDRNQTPYKVDIHAG